MHHDYRDIIDRITELPSWWDENGVPRYGPFAPKLVANIYAREIVLVDIQCQGCGEHFDVAMSWGGAGDIVHRTMSLTARVLDGTIHYGDPPNAGCCPSGPTMNSIAVRVLQFWEEPIICKATRVPLLERAVTPNQGTNPDDQDGS